MSWIRCCAMTHAKLVPELLCSNLEKTLHFYVELVGFTIQYDRPEDRFAYLSMDGVEIMVEEAPETSEDPRVWWTAKAVHPYGRGINRSEERRVGKECRSQWSP